MYEDLNETIRRLKKVQRSNKRLIRERTAAESKMLVHDRLGGCVFATMRLMEDALQEDDYEDTLVFWEETLSLLFAGRTPDALFDATAALKELERTARVVGCRISYEGVLPESTRAVRLIVLLLNETLPNAVRHSQADELYVKITQGSTTVLVEITNNGPICPTTVVEGNGLTALRNRLESEGALLEYITADGFLIRATIPL